LGTWRRRTRFHIEDNDVATTETNVPVLLHLSSNSGVSQTNFNQRIFEELHEEADKYKIAVTTSDGTTQCYVEIERWDLTNKEAWLLIKIPSISSTTRTYMYLYYDRMQDDNTTYVGNVGSTVAQNVWNSNYTAVYHLHDEDATTVIEDSTSNERDGTRRGNGEPIQTDGKIGYGQSFDGATDDNDYITIPESAVDMTGELTIELLGKITKTVGHYQSLLRRSTVGGVGGFSLEVDATDDARFFIYTTVGGWSTPAGIAITDDTWTYYAGRFDAVNLRHKLTVNQTTTSRIPAGLPLNNPTGARTRIGRSYNAFTVHGEIDEVRISNVYCSDAWLNISYLSANDNLLHYIGEEFNCSPLWSIYCVKKRLVDLAEDAVGETPHFANVTGEWQDLPRKLSYLPLVTVRVGPSMVTEETYDEVIDPEQTEGYSTSGSYETYDYTIHLFASACKEAHEDSNKYVQQLADDLTNYLQKERSWQRGFAIKDILPSVTRESNVLRMPRNVRRINLDGKIWIRRENE